MPDKKSKDVPKAINEKPASLSSLDVKEALAAILQVIIKPSKERKIKPVRED